MTADSPSRSVTRCRVPVVVGRASLTLRSRPKKGTVAAGSSRATVGPRRKELRSRRDRPSATQSPKDVTKGSGASGYAVPAVDEVEDTRGGVAVLEPATRRKSNGREIASTFHALYRGVVLGYRRSRDLSCPRAVASTLSSPPSLEMHPTAGLFPRVAACGSRHMLSSKDARR